MLTTMFLGAVCALALNASVAVSPADTIDRYVINGEKVEKFDGSQLVGKTVSDYKILTATGQANGEVLRVHVICTDGQELKNAAVLLHTTTVYIIDGKKCDKESLNKIKPASIASMIVYKAGSKEAVKLSGKDNVAVIDVVTK